MSLGSFYVSSTTFKSSFYLKVKTDHFDHSSFVIFIDCQGSGESVQVEATVYPEFYGRAD